MRLQITRELFKFESDPAPAVEPSGFVLPRGLKCVHSEVSDLYAPSEKPDFWLTLNYGSIVLARDTYQVRKQHLSDGIVYSKIVPITEGSTDEHNPAQ